MKMELLLTAKNDKGVLRQAHFEVEINKWPELDWQALSLNDADKPWAPVAIVKVEAHTDKTSFLWPWGGGTK